MNKYTVKQSDTLWKIARKQGTTVDSILAANPNIQDRNLIFPKQVISIPVDAPHTADSKALDAIDEAFSSKKLTSGNSPNGTSELPSAVTQCVKQKTKEVWWVVHGTSVFKDPKSSKDNWWQTEGDFVKSLEKAGLKNIWLDTSTKDQFIWNGDNDPDERKKAGKELKKAIDAYKKKYPDRNINIIAHSHGGNVVHEALNDGAEINNLVLLGTPHMYDPDYNWHGKLIKNDYLHKPDLDNVEGSVHNVYSNEDRVQVDWADDATTWEAGRKPKYKTSPAYTSIEVTPILEKKFPEDDHSGPIDGINVHSKLHHPEIAEYIVDLINRK